MGLLTYQISNYKLLSLFLDFSFNEVNKGTTHYEHEFRIIEIYPFCVY